MRRITISNVVATTSTRATRRSSRPRRPSVEELDLSNVGILYGRRHP